MCMEYGYWVFVKYGSSRRNKFLAMVTEKGCSGARVCASRQATQSFTNEFGTLYVVDFRMSTSHGEATVRSHWIVRGYRSPRIYSPREVVTS